MPPDRHAPYRSYASTSESQSQSQKDKGQSIAKGLACLACRKRKVKCDSQKPVCSGCLKTAKGDMNSISCEYDDVTGPKKKRSSPGTVAALEAANSALQAELDELKQYISRTKPNLPTPPQTDYMQCQIDGLSMPFGDTSTKSIGALTSGPSTRGYQPVELARTVPRDPRGSVYSASLELEEQLVGGLAASGGALGSVEAEGGGGGGPSLDFTSPQSPAEDYWTQLIYPGWPKDLPSYELTSRLLEVWFNKPHCLSGLLNAASFRAAMLHPPSTAGFPHPALIHSMMAIASMLVSDDFFANEPRYWPQTQSVTEYHASRGKVGLDQAIAHGQRLLQVSQAVTILCYQAYTQARFVELWLLCGMATRIITPLGLNQLASPLDSSQFKMHLLPPPKDDAELYERSVNCWYAFMSDRMATACTGWAHSIEEADIITLLPTNASSSFAGDFESSPLSPRSPSFLLAHPPHLVGPMQLELKAIVLLGRVNTFVQRAPLIMQRDQSGLNSAAPDIRKTDAFRRLENDIIGFTSSIPREYQSSGAAIGDPRLHIVHSLPPASTLLLHERFITAQKNDPSAPLSLQAAQQIMQVLHTLMSTSFEIGLLSPFLNYVWVVAGRTIVREIAFRMIRNQQDGIEQLRGDVQTILLALHACKTPLATSTAKQLQTLFDDPYKALPMSAYQNQCPGSAAASARPHPTEGLGMNYSQYPNSDFASSNGTPSSSSSYKPFTPPDSTPSSSISSHPPIPNPNAKSTEKTFQEIDQTLKQGFFGNLGDNTFGPELEALIHGSRASAPWLAGGNSVPRPANTSVNVSNAREEVAFSPNNPAFAIGLGRFEELDSQDLMRLDSLSSMFATSTSGV